MPEWSLQEWQKISAEPQSTDVVLYLMSHRPTANRAPPKYLSPTLLATPGQERTSPVCAERIPAFGAQAPLDSATHGAQPASDRVRPEYRTSVKIFDHQKIARGFRPGRKLSPSLHPVLGFSRTSANAARYRKFLAGIIKRARSTRPTLPGEMENQDMRRGSAWVSETQPKSSMFLGCGGTAFAMVLGGSLHA